MEPRASRPQGRLDAIRELRAAGVPVGVMVAPIIPGLNDFEMPAILRAAADAGAMFAAYTVLRLPHGVGELFDNWLAHHYPDRKEKILGRLRDLREGALNDPRFGTRMKGEGAMAKMIGGLFAISRTKVGLSAKSPTPSAAAFRRPGCRSRRRC